MRGFTKTAMLVIAVSGLGACNRGGNNSAAKATNNNAAAATSNAAAPAPGAQGMDDQTFLSTFTRSCEAQIRSSAPALDPAQICGCVVEASFAGKTGLFVYSQSPAAQQEIPQNTARCLSQQGGGAAAEQPGSDAEEGTPAEDGEE